MHKGKGSGLVPWPQRLTIPPPRLDDIGISAEEFQADTVSYRDYPNCLNHVVLSLTVIKFNFD